MNKESDFDKIQKIIQDLWNDGLIQRGSGHCFAMSDIVHKLLIHHGIESYLQECSLMIFKKNIDDLILIGYSISDTSNPVTDVKTHVVCITKTEEPILIDLSVCNLVNNVPYICEKIDKDSKKLVNKFAFENGHFIYTKKYTDYQLPILHERSITDRIKTDNKIFSEIKFIKIFLFVMFVVSFLNFSRGIIDFYYTVLHPELHPTRDLKLKKHS